MYGLFVVSWLPKKSLADTMPTWKCKDKVDVLHDALAGVITDVPLHNPTI